MNKALMTSLISIGATQLLKVPIKFVGTGRWDWKTAVQTGGMPSSHSAGVSSLATYVALKKGISSVPFALASLFGLIVMYDAMGIRRRAGEIAMEVNRLETQVEKLTEQHPQIYHRKMQKELEERLGHMPREVLGGALFGVAIGTLSYLTDRNRRKRWF
ncbi:divergent PAP2 family protein [Paenibacillus hamazuiensis]|uniref:divergent PAP2 family protein n=1 Tax=Paenibacillus hamazuiensis TaxID=2936508 RepID=UPI00200F64FE|nr:divergent PAP2 family protein [Paenibacillus hamazuiensis]